MPNKPTKPQFRSTYRRQLYFAFTVRLNLSSVRLRVLKFPGENTLLLSPFSSFLPFSHSHIASCCHTFPACCVFPWLTSCAAEQHRYISYIGAPSHFVMEIMWRSLVYVRSWQRSHDSVFAETPIFVFTKSTIVLCNMSCLWLDSTQL